MKKMEEKLEEKLAKIEKSIPQIRRFVKYNDFSTDKKETIIGATDVKHIQVGTYDVVVTKERHIDRYRDTNSLIREDENYGYIGIVWQERGKNPEHAKVGCKDLSLSIGSVSLEYCNNSWVKPLDDKTIEVDWADCADRPVDNVGTRYIVDLKDKTAIRSDTHSKKHFNPQKKKLFIYG